MENQVMLLTNVSKGMVDIQCMPLPLPTPNQKSQKTNMSNLKSDYEILPWYVM
jgi:hypothetical protein